MVALAPITNETPAWDVLDTFPKLHSRAREVKTTTCTEVPMHKSRSRIEIWLTIYDCRDGLESFTRDPIGYEGSEWFLYEYTESKPLHYVDPFGQMGLNPLPFSQLYQRNGGPLSEWPPGKHASFPMPIDRCFSGLFPTSSGPNTWEEVYGKECAPVYHGNAYKCGQHYLNCMKICDKIGWPYFTYAGCKKNCERAERCCTISVNKLISDCLANATEKGADPSRPEDPNIHKNLKCKNTYGDPIPPISNGPFDRNLF